VSFTAYYPLNPAIGPVGTRVKFTYEFKIVETADTYNVLYVPNAFAEDVTCRNYNGQPFYVEGDTGECTLYYTFTEDDVRRGYGAHSIQIHYGVDSATYSVLANDPISFAPPAPPSATPASLTVDQDSNSNSIDLAPYFAGAVADHEVRAAPSHGTAWVSGTTLYYTPNAGFQGTDQLTFSASNYGGKNVASAQLSITVNEVVAPPVLTAMSLTAHYNDEYGTWMDAYTLSGGPTDYLALGATAPSKGVVTFDGLFFNYKPNPGAYGSDTFSLRAVGPGGTAEANVSVTISAMPPVAAVVNTLAQYNGDWQDIDLATFVSGDIDDVVLFDPINGSSQPKSGLVIQYKPNPGFFGADSFSFRLEGPAGTSVGMVNVLVMPPPAPVAGNPSLSAAYDGPPVTLDLADHVTGVHDTIVIAAAPTKGTAVMTSATEVSYKPLPGQYGTDSFTFTATNPDGSATGTVSVTISTPGAPVASGTSQTVPFNPLSPAVIDVTTLVTGPFTSIEIADEPTKGVIGPHGRVQFDC
jgi:hypothetical protein